MTDSPNLLKTVHKAFIDFNLRAEKSSAEMLVETFVDSEPLMDILSSSNNSVIYGRRGTGKTHALKYLETQIVEGGDACLYIDLRSIGSNRSMYSEIDKSLTERASYLINDVLEALLSTFYGLALSALEKAPHPETIAVRLDDFQASIGSVKLKGQIERETEKRQTEASTRSGSLSASISENPKINAKAATSSADSLEAIVKEKSQGTEIIHIEFGSVQTSLEGLIKVLGIGRIWLLIDEWSEVPNDLQPYLADLLLRIILPVKNCILKIAAIEHRSNFHIPLARGEYIGLELGADVSANLNLDDFLVFDANEERSINFFKHLIFHHYRNSESKSEEIQNADDLIRLAFTQQNAFVEFVQAVEGVPRDALNLAAIAATKAYGHKISVNHVRGSARDWYQRDKSSVLRGSPEIAQALHVINNEVIGKRKARAFLFRNDTRNDTIEVLFDARLLHILKRNISSKDTPGIRYDVYKLDYGCYVDLLNTSSSPTMLFEADEGSVDVPKDDYRSIRRSVLDPDMLITKHA